MLNTFEDGNEFHGFASSPFALAEIKVENKLLFVNQSVIKGRESEIVIFNSSPK
jgi:hypothetical protein